MLVKTTFMLKPLGARRKKTFGYAAAGGFLIDRVERKKYFFPAEFLGPILSNDTFRYHL